MLDPPVKPWATTTVHPLTRAIVSRLVGDGPQPPAPLPVPEEATYREWEKALLRKKQVIFYGPPGTGKTRAARGFARWWLSKELDAGGPEDEVEANLTFPGRAERAWWVTANPTEWSWKQLFEHDGVSYRRGKIARNYERASSGDVVVCYEAAPTRRIVGLARVVNVHGEDDDEPLRLLPIRQISPGVAWEELQTDALVSQSEPVQHRSQGTLFALTTAEFRRVLELAGLTDLYLDRTPHDLVGFLTSVTFHASYSYEEFVEGYRPVRTDAPGLTLELRDGIVKRVARTAGADEPNPYVVLIDEINRANVPRVFGELMTVLEADKRNSPVTLPTSGGRLSLPDNVYLVGTMNTADRSIRTLDAALRRRFAFIELMPDPAVLAGGVVDELQLDVFLENLNRQIVVTAGREKQIGHSFFLIEDQPLQTADELAEVMHFEVIPLLQEIAFDDYGQLELYLGKEIVDVEEQRLRAAAHDPTSFVAALAKKYQAETSATD